MRKIIATAVAGLLLVASPAVAQHALQREVTDPCDSSSRGPLGFSTAGLNFVLTQKHSRRVVCEEGASNADMRGMYLMTSLLVSMRLRAVASTMDPDAPFHVRYWSEEIENRLQRDMMKRLERRVTEENMTANEALVAELKVELDWMDEFTRR